MIKGFLYRLEQRLRPYLRLLSLRKAVFLRFLLCWMAGLAVLVFDEARNYDLRLRVRPAQPRSDQIVLIMMTESDLNPVLAARARQLDGWDLPASPEDDDYWNQMMWEKVLGNILSGSPKAVGVSLTYAESSLGLSRAQMRSSPIRDPRVFWSVKIRSDERPVVPRFIEQNQQFVSHASFPVDTDGTVRRFHENNPVFRHLTTNLAQMAQSGYVSKVYPHQFEDKMINFRGPPGIFKKFDFGRILRGDYSPALFRDKIVIIGIDGSERHMLRTPVGMMTRAELVATTLDNVIRNRWITRADPVLSAAGLLVVLIFCTYFIFSYPQSVAFVFLFWLGVALTAGSCFLFDSMNYWTPALSALIQIVVTYVIYLTHLLNVKENRAWRLEQERKYYYEIEQLKNNFVSLISHDLKTPIAKLQAIIDRQLVKSERLDLIEDLKLIRRESQELNRYIESILKMTQVESKEIKLRHEAMDFNLMVETVVTGLSPLAQQKQIRLETDLEPLFLIEADSVLVQEVVLNLIENAIKYTHDNTVVKVTSREDQGEIVFTVQDQGPGIPLDEQPLIFQKFYRGRAANSTQKGSGLGLYLVKYFIELHEGRVFLTSDPQNGTIIGFRLPMASAEQNKPSEGVQI